MLPTAAPPVAGAALRLLRTAAGRRALQTSLLVGGVFALGFLCGEQARAADGRTPTALTTQVASAAERAAQPLLAATTGAPAGQPAGNSAERNRKPQPDHRPHPNQKPQSNQKPQPGHKPQPNEKPQPGQKPQPNEKPHPNQKPQSNEKPYPNQKPESNEKPRLKPELFQKPGECGEPRQEQLAAPTKAPRVPASADRAGSLVAEAVGSVVRPVADTVVRPVGDLVETLTGELTTSLPETPPSLPALPAVPPVRAVPSLPSPTSPPGLFPPAPSRGDREQLPPADPDHPQHSGAVGAPVPHPVAPRAAGREPGSTAVLAYGPASLRGDVRAGATHAGHGHDGHHGGRQVTGPARARQAPAGDSSGAPGDRPAVDGGVSRHGDAYAVAPDHRAPLRLVSGTSEAVTAAGTRDRYRDIPLFPG
ncbi:hypothetical protein [Streptomyces sp. NPDC002769]|uniref:hypothetical protein n=1 Tax=Streptomyces sp. NPDC002769 TaxID=3154542 RepID=UPI00333329AE